MIIMQQLQTHYSGGILTLVNKDWPVITKMFITDLSQITATLHDVYHARGPLPRDPASMLRSYLLMLLTNPAIDVTEWVNELHRVPLYAILSGFEPGDVPGIGTFYDLFERLWASENRMLRIKAKQKGKKIAIKPGCVKRLV